MFELLPLRPDHEGTVHDFERSNREYFATSINDRGDDFFENFPERFRELLAEQDSGDFACHLLVDDDESVVGRFNLYDINDGHANVGYRVAQRVSGRGVATDGLRGLCRIARDDLHLTTLHAAVSRENVASQRVLEKVGFIEVGPVAVAGRDGAAYALDLRY